MNKLHICAMWASLSAAQLSIPVNARLQHCGKRLIGAPTLLVFDRNSAPKKRCADFLKRWPGNIQHPLARSMNLATGSRSTWNKVLSNTGGVFAAS